MKHLPTYITVFLLTSACVASAQTSLTGSDSRTEPWSENVLKDDIKRLQRPNCCGTGTAPPPGATPRIFAIPVPAGSLTSATFVGKLKDGYKIENGPYVAQSKDVKCNTATSPEDQLTLNFSSHLANRFGNGKIDITVWNHRPGTDVLNCSTRSDLTTPVGIDGTFTFTGTRSYSATASVPSTIDCSSGTCGGAVQGTLAGDGPSALSVEIDGQRISSTASRAPGTFSIPIPHIFENGSYPVVVRWNGLTINLGPITITGANPPCTDSDDIRAWSLPACTSSPTCNDKLTVKLRGCDADTLTLHAASDGAVLATFPSVEPGPVALEHSLSGVQLRPGWNQYYLKWGTGQSGTKGHWILPAGTLVTHPAGSCPTNVRLRKTDGTTMSLPSNKGAYTSSDPSVATVDADGNIIWGSAASGSTTITFTLNTCSDCTVQGTIQRVADGMVLTSSPTDLLLCHKGTGDCAPSKKVEFDLNSCEEGVGAAFSWELPDGTVLYQRNTLYPGSRSFEPYNATRVGEYNGVLKWGSHTHPLSVAYFPYEELILDNSDCPTKAILNPPLTPTSPGIGSFSVTDKVGFENFTVDSQGNIDYNFLNNSSTSQGSATITYSAPGFCDSCDVSVEVTVERPSIIQFEETPFVCLTDQTTKNSVNFDASSVVSFDIELQLDGDPAGAATVAQEGQGRFIFSPLHPLTNGEHTFAASVVNAEPDCDPEPTTVNIDVFGIRGMFREERTCDSFQLHASDVTSATITENIKWTLQEHSGFSKPPNIDANGFVSEIHVPPSASGDSPFMIVRAAHETCADCYQDFRIDLSCDSCGNDGNCMMPEELDSLGWSFNMIADSFLRGQRNDFNLPSANNDNESVRQLSQPRFSVYSEVIDDDFFNASNIRIGNTDPNVRILWSNRLIPAEHADKPVLANGPLYIDLQGRDVQDPDYEGADDVPFMRQVIAPGGLVDIQPTPLGYTLRAYTIDQVLPLQPNGLYLVPVNTAYQTITVERLGPQSARILKQSSGRTLDHVYSVDAAGSWTLDINNGDFVETLEPINATTKLRTRSGPLGQSFQAEQTEGPGRRLEALVLDPMGLDPISTTYAYQPDGLLERIDQNNGSYIAYTYTGDDAANNIATITQPHAAGGIQVTQLDYTPPPGDSDLRRHRSLPRSVVTRVNGTITHQAWTLFQQAPNGEISHTLELAVRNDAQRGDPTNLKTDSTFYPDEETGPASGRIKSVLQPDKTLISYTYERGGGTENFAPNPNGRSIRITAVSGTQAQPDGIPYRSTSYQGILNHFGKLAYAQTFVKTPAGRELISWEQSGFDERGRLRSEKDNLGLRTLYGWDCCGLETITAADGTVASIGYDSLGRSFSSTELAVNANGLQLPDYVRRATLDASGNTLASSITGGTLTLGSSSTYDLAGRMINTTDPAGLVTVTAYDTPNRTITTTYPDLGTRTITAQADGSIETISGTAVIPTAFSYVLTPAGHLRTTVTRGTAPDQSTTTRETDLLGRLVRAETPVYTDNQIETSVTTMQYDDMGRLIRQTSSGEPDVLFTYDPVISELQYSGLDLNGDGQLTLASEDRISYGSERFLKDATTGDWWIHSVAQTFPVLNDPTPQTLSESYLRVTGHAANQIAESILIDAQGLTTSSSSVLTRGNRTTTVTTILPDSDTPAKTTIVAGLTLNSQDATGFETTTSYDDLRRAFRTTNPLTGATTVSFDPAGRPEQVTDSENRFTRFSYDPVSGYRTATENSAGEITRKAYNLRGQTEVVYGSTYPIRYGYDALGRMDRMHTFRNLADPHDLAEVQSAAGSQTSWDYGPAGRLIQKRDHADKGASYTYDLAGRTRERLWARGVQTDFDYTPAGELDTVTYSDGTPTIDFTHDRLGRVATVEDATGLRSYHRDATGLLEREQQAPTLAGLAPETIHYDHDAVIPGRLAAIRTDSGYLAAYNYTPRGLLETVGLGQSGPTSTYSYDPNSSRVAGLEFSANPANAAANPGDPAAPAAPFLSTLREYTAAGLLERISHSARNPAVDADAPATSLRSFTYTHDAAARRNTLTTEDGRVWNYGYNEKGEVTSAAQTEAPGTPAYRRDYTYQYDHIGNRTETSEHGTGITANWTANDLNQITDRDVLPHVLVEGATDPLADVRIHSSAADTTGTPASTDGNGNFRGLVSADNADQVGRIEPEVRAERPGPNGLSEQRSETRKTRVAANPEAIAYDDDGNMQSDSRWLMEWNAENRLTAVSARNPQDGEFRVENTYDYRGRRVLKRVRVWAGGGWTASHEIQFVYAGWSVLTEVRRELAGGGAGPVEETTAHTYWGLDVDGTVGGAGGVGGLLGRTTWDASGTADTVLYSYDGNGNVTQLYGQDGAELARYEYSPFGKTLVAASAPGSDAAARNPWRFSTHYTDDETGWVYYGYRFYNAEAGAWVSRDPIAEKGGLNLYGFCQNDPVNKYDLLGLSDVQYGEAYGYWNDSKVYIGETKKPAGSRKGDSNHPTKDKIMPTDKGYGSSVSRIMGLPNFTRRGPRFGKLTPGQKLNYIKRTAEFAKLWDVIGHDSKLIGPKGEVVTLEGMMAKDRKISKKVGAYRISGGPHDGKVLVNSLGDLGMSGEKMRIAKKHFGVALKSLVPKKICPKPQIGAKPSLPSLKIRRFSARPRINMPRGSAVEGLASMGMQQVSKHLVIGTELSSCLGDAQKLLRGWGLKGGDVGYAQIGVYEYQNPSCPGYVVQCDRVVVNVSLKPFAKPMVPAWEIKPPSTYRPDQIGSAPPPSSKSYGNLYVNPPKAVYTGTATWNVYQVEVPIEPNFLESLFLK